MTLLAAVLIVIGLVGVVVPVLPGLLLVWAGVAVWCFDRHDVTGWVVLAVATVLAAAGTAAKYLLPGRQLRSQQVPWTTLAAGALLAVLGFFLLPVVGVAVGFVGGVYLAELARLGSHATAWPSTKAALKAVGWSILIELATGLLMTAAWIAGLVLG